MVHGVSAVPPQRTPDEDRAPASRDVLRSFGLDVLVDMIEKSSYGVCITGDDHTWLYLNPAAAELVGKPFEDLYGGDYLESFPPHERDALLALEADQRAGDTRFYTNTVIRDDGSEREMTWSGTVVQSAVGEVAPAIFHDTSRIRRAQREASALAAAAAQVAAGGDTDAVIDALAEAAVATTRAVACVVLIAADALTGDGSGPLRLAGCSDDGETGSRLDATLDVVALSLSDLPGGVLLTGRRPVLLGDHRRRLLADRAAAPIAVAVTDRAWEGSALLPLRTDGRVVGCLIALLPPEVRSPSEEETEFWSSLGDQISAALTTDRLRAQVSASATAAERMRIGRDLHDSVSHELFALRQRAELIERALDSGDDALLRAAASGLKETSQQAITDLRELLAEMRPVPPKGSTASADLSGSLHALAAHVTARHALRVDVDVDSTAGRQAADLDDVTCEHLRRVAGEALHNTVKHAGATRATIRLAADEGELVLSVRDNGLGMGQTRTPGGHGMRTMRERMALCHGSLTVTDAPGSGTDVVARLPLADA